MKTFIYLQGFLLLLYIVGIQGRHVDQNENEDLTEVEEEIELLNRNRDHTTLPRHRRRSRQMHGYDYTPPYYYDNRRDYSIRQQEELLSRILKSLDDIIVNIRRPTPPPQPIYVPYPVIQYVPSCSGQPNAQIPTNEITTESSVPNVTDRFTPEDNNQIWGQDVDPIELVKEEGDGSRPINLRPIRPSRPMSRPPPPVEHGSSQAGAEQTTAAPVRRPGACETAILTCCSIQERSAQRNCFARYDCMKTYATNRACDPDIIKRVLEHFSSAYAPIKN